MQTPLKSKSVINNDNSRTCMKHTMEYQRYPFKSAQRNNSNGFKFQN